MTATNGNGHAPSVERLREEIARENAAAELAEARHRRELWESLGAFRYPDEWANPYGYRRDDLGNRWYPLGAGGVTAPTRDGRNYPFVQTDSDLDSMRAMAHWLTTKNDMAIGVMGSCRDYTIKQGYRWEAKPAKGYEDDGRANELAAACQRVVDLDSDLNKLPSRERSAFCRAFRDGDVGVRHFRQYDGTTRHRFVRAEQIRDPGGIGPHASHGVETDPDDVEDVQAYHVTYDGGITYQRVPADEISFYKRNVDEEVKRGLSDFFSGGEAFDEVSKLLRAMRRGATLLAKIAWIEEFANTTNDQLNALASANRPQGLPQVRHPITGQIVKQQYIDDGTTIYTKDNRKFQSPPLANNTSNFTAIADACLRTAGVRWRVPEHVISGNASQNNVALILVAGAPFVNAIECAQDDFGGWFLRWRWVAIRNACRAGLIRATFEEVQALVDLKYTPPQVAVANEQAQAAVDHADMDKGVMSKQTRAARRGLDWEQERKNLAEEPAGQGGAAPGGEAPPSPFDESHLREALWLDANAYLLEAAGQKREKGVPFQGPSGKWFVVNDKGRTVPSKNPQAGKGAAKRAAKPKPDKAKASAALDAVAKGGASPERLRELADHLGAMTVAELRTARQKLAASFGGASKKEAMVQALRAHVAKLKGAPEEKPDEQASAIERPKYQSGQKIGRDELRAVLAKAPDPAARAALMKEIMAEAGKDMPAPVQKHGMAKAAPMKAASIGGVAVFWEEGAAAAPAAVAEWLASDVPAALRGSTRSVTFTVQANKDDAKWEQRYGIEGFRSDATGGDGSVVVYGAGRHAPTAGLLNHESGHNLAERIWGVTAPPGGSPYAAAQEAEGPVSKYGANSPSEDFAEACRMYADPKQAEALRNKFPKKYQAIDALMREHAGREG